MLSAEGGTLPGIVKDWSMRREKEVHELVLQAARELGVEDAAVERRRRHPCLIGSIGGKSILVVLSGTSTDKNSFAVARQYLRREVRRACEVHSET